MRISEGAVLADVFGMIRGGRNYPSSVASSQPHIVGKYKATTDSLLKPVHWKVPTTQRKGKAMKEQNGNGFAPSIAQVVSDMKENRSFQETIAR